MYSIRLQTVDKVWVKILTLASTSQSYSKILQGKAWRKVSKYTTKDSSSLSADS